MEKETERSEDRSVKSSQSSMIKAWLALNRNLNVVTTRFGRTGLNSDSLIHSRNIFLLWDEPDGFPFEGNFHKLPFLNMEASVGKVRHRDLEIVIVPALFEEERMLCPLLNDADDLQSRQVFGIEDFR
jgi:hypothetical protein